MSEMFVAIKTETEILGAIECTPKVKGCEMNHVTSRMIEKASFDTTPFNRSNTKTVVFNTALELMKQAVAEAAGESEVKK